MINDDERPEPPPVSDYISPDLIEVLDPLDADLLTDTIQALLKVWRTDLARYVARLVGPLEHWPSSRPTASAIDGLSKDAVDLVRIAEITEAGGRFSADVRGALDELLLIAKAPNLSDDERREHGRQALERRGLQRYAENP